MFTSGILGKTVLGKRIIILALLGAFGACDDGASEAPGDAGPIDGDAAIGDRGVLDMDPIDPAPDAGLVDMGEPPDAQLGPAVPVVEAPVQVTPESIFVGAVDGVAALDPDTLTFTSAGRLWWIDNAAPVELGDAERLDAAAWYDDLPVIAADGAVWVLQDDGLARSPLSDEVSGVSDLAVADGALWIAGAEGLFRFVDGAIQEMVPQDLPVGDARMTADGDDLWIGAGGEIYAVTPEHAQPTPAVSGAIAPVVDESGVWVIGERRLWWLDEALFWWPIELPMQPTRAAAHPGATGVWLSDDVDLWLLSEGSLLRYEGAPTPTAGARQAMIADGSGAVLIAADDGLWRVTAERFIRVEVPQDRVTRPADVTIAPALPAQVTRVTAAVNDVALEVRGANPWTLTLSPDLGEGPQTLRVTVEWDDGERGARETAFVAHTVNWAEDIHPLNQTECAQCHGQGGTARPLHSAEQWIARIGEVIDATQMARMPLDGPLSPAQVQLIIDWQAAGLPEDRE